MAVVKLAAANKLEVFLDPIETGGWLTTFREQRTRESLSFRRTSGSATRSTRMSYGTAATIFRAGTTSATDNNLVHQVMLGIASASTGHADHRTE